jgi:hypothetical protein
MALPDSGKVRFNYYGEMIDASYEVTRVLAGAKPDILIRDHQGREFDWSLTDAELDTMTIEDLEKGLSDKYREKEKGVNA